SISGIATPGSITGNATPCQNTNNVTYSVLPVPNATSYTWTVPTGVTIVSGQGTNSITVNWLTTGGNICVTASTNCETSGNSCLLVSLQTTPNVPSISPASNVTCTSFDANWV